MTQVLRRLRQEDPDFEASLSYVGRPSQERERDGVGGTSIFSYGV